MTDYLTPEEAKAQNAKEAEFCITLLAKDRLVRAYGSGIKQWPVEVWNNHVQHLIENFDDDDIAIAVEKYAYKR